MVLVRTIGKGGKYWGSLYGDEKGKGVTWGSSSELVLALHALTLNTKQSGSQSIARVNSCQVVLNSGVSRTGPHHR